MSEISGENSKVTFTVKELFGQINDGIKDLRLRLDLKADHKDLEELKKDVNEHNGRIARLETVEKERDKGAGFHVARREFLILILAMILAPLIPLLLVGAIHT